MSWIDTLTEASKTAAQSAQQLQAFQNSAGPTYTNKGGGTGGGGGFQFTSIEQAEAEARRLQGVYHRIVARHKKLMRIQLDFKHGFCDDPASKDFSDKGALSVRSLIELNKSMAEYTQWLHKNITDAIKRHRENDDATARALGAGGAMAESIGSSIL